MFNQPMMIYRMTTNQHIKNKEWDGITMRKKEGFHLKQSKPINKFQRMLSAPDATLIV